MKTQEIIDRLKSECPIFGGRVAGSAAYDLAIEENGFSTPCAYVVELSKSSKPNSLISGHSQQVTLQIGVMMIISNQRDTTGHAAHEELQDVSGQVWDALCGWQVSEFNTPFEHVRGQSSGSYDLNRFWADVFTTSYHYRK
jgi:hypothetical protein